MKPASFDLPYGPLAAALRVLGTPIIVAAFVIFLSFGVWSFMRQRAAEYSIHSSDIASHAANYADAVYVSKGAAGPYKQGPGVTGCVGAAVGLDVGEHSVRCPAVAGSYYDISSYINKDGGTYVLAMLVKKHP